MKIALTGPFDTSTFEARVGQKLPGAPAGQGGYPVTEHAAALIRLGYSVSVVTLDPAVEEPVSFSNTNFDITYCPLRAAPRYRARTRALDLFEAEIRYLETAIRATKPDIVHAHWTCEYAEAAIRSGYPHLVTMHDLGWENLIQFRDAYRLARLVMAYRTMPRIRALTAVAPFMVPKARLYGYLGRVAVIPNGIEIPEHLPDRIHARSLERPKIVTVGSNTRLKNVSRSVEAFQIVRRHIPRAELHLFGPGLDESYAEGIPSVVGHGNVAHGELMRFLEAEATILVHPSRVETFGVIIAEAKARALPVVGGARSGGVPFVCGNAGARLVNVERPNEIASATLDLLLPEKHTEASCAGRIDAEHRFGSSAIMEKYVGLYNKVLERTNA